MTQREIVLKALRAAGSGGVTNGELNRAGVFRYSARIFELRQRGFRIRTESHAGGLARFFLEAEPESAAPPPSDPKGEEARAGGGEQAALFDLPERKVLHPLRDPEAA